MTVFAIYQFFRLCFVCSFTFSFLFLSKRLCVFLFIRLCVWIPFFTLWEFVSKFFFQDLPVLSALTLPYSWTCALLWAQHQYFLIIQMPNFNLGKHPKVFGQGTSVQNFSQIPSLLKPPCTSSPTEDKMLFLSLYFKHYLYTFLSLFSTKLVHFSTIYDLLFGRRPE